MAGKVKQKQALPTAKNIPMDGFVNAASDPLFQRRILFHPARKTAATTVNGFGGFNLEPLNPLPDTRRVENQRECEPATRRTEDPLDSELTQGVAFRRIGAGLANLGNTCFLNSVLQCLTYTEPLAAYFQSSRHKSTCRIAGFCAMCAVQNHVMNALGSSGKILSPTFLARNLRCISRNFRISRQEDAHEYMMNLMEAMHKCCLPPGIASESPVAYEKSLVHKIFGGRLLSQVKCTQCSYCSDTFDPFLDLSLQIVRADSLLKALSHFTAVEQLDGGEKRYQCERCKVKVQALKQLTIDKAPHILVIHLKRFSPGGSGGKIDKKVDFGCTLDMKPFVSSSHEGELKYILYGVLVHAGWSTHSGHYFCFVRTSTGIWHALDDSRVYQVSEKSVLEQKAYMLFYVQDKRTGIMPAIRPHHQDNGHKVSSKESQLQASSTPAIIQNPSSISINTGSIIGKDKILKKNKTLPSGASVSEATGAILNDMLPSSVGEPVIREPSLQVTSGNMDIGAKETLSKRPSNNGCHDAKYLDDGYKAVKISKNGSMGNGNGDQAVKHSENDSTSNDDAHWADKHPKNNSTGNGNGHRSGKHSRSNLEGNLAAANRHEAREHLNNGAIASYTTGDKHNAKHLGNSGMVNGVVLKKFQSHKISKHMRKINHISMQKHPKHPRNCVVSGKNLKSQKHLGWPQYLKIMPFTRQHFLLRAISILRKRSTHKRKKYCQVEPKSASQSNSISLLKSGKRMLMGEAGALSGKRLITVKADALSKKNRSAGAVDRKAFSGTEKTATNSCGLRKIEQNNIKAHSCWASEQDDCRHLSSVNVACVLGDLKGGIGDQFCGNGSVRSNVLDSKCILAVAEPSARINEEQERERSTQERERSNVLDSKCILAVAAPSARINEEQERERSTQEFMASSVEAKLYGVTVSCWSGVDADREGIENAWNNKKARVGHVLDEWDEEYDRGKRKKVKRSQLEAHINGGDKRHSIGHSNPFQAIASRNAKTLNHKGKSIVRTRPARI